MTEIEKIDDELDVQFDILKKEISLIEFKIKNNLYFKITSEREVKR